MHILWKGWCRAPIDNLVNLNRVQNLTFRSANLAYNCDFMSADKQLLTGKSSSTIFHMLHYLINILEVFPNEAVNAAIFWNSLEDSIIILISRCRATNRYIVDIWNGIFWNFRLKDVSYIIVEYGNCVCPSHRQFSEVKHTVGCLKGCIVACTHCIQHRGWVSHHRCSQQTVWQSVL